MAGAKLESRKAAILAYVENVGPYDKVPWDVYMEKLYDFAKAKKVMPGFYPLGIYYDSPSTTDMDKLRCDIAIPIYKQVKGEGDIKVKKLPAMKVATISHKGSGEEYVNTYRKLHDWIKEKGLVVVGPPMEIYTKKPKVVKGMTILYSKVMMPVKKVTEKK
ncbi:MAG: hypothetical protein A3K60_08165 [Euryarchaeota archaeon RBG_19FT_COMBO_56_21]|nr:MAG: hypothetical protein A3K60_08165 [Euryarchaeota archaeon RBG_19FT_COMBO_56_21]